MYRNVIYCKKFSKAMTRTACQCNLDDWHEMHPVLRFPCVVLGMLSTVM